MIYVLSGGQTGATLTVTSSGTGTITVSNTTLGKSYSKSVTAGGSVVFKGLKTGTWTITLTNGTQTSTKTIVITSDYSTTIAYFSATISITYPATSTCVVKNASGQTVASNTNTGTSVKTWTATVNATGTYTVTATATDGSGDTASEIVKITSNGQSVSVELGYYIPGSYQRVEYLQSSGTQYIDTGVSSTSVSPNFVLDAKGVVCTALPASGQQNTLFGAGTNSYSNTLPTVSLLQSTQTFYWYCGGAVKQGITKIVVGTKYDVLFGYNQASSLYFNGYLNTNADVEIVNTSGTFTTGVNLVLFGYKHSGGFLHGWVGRIGEVKLSNDGVDIRHFVPCYRKADGVVGMYDRVTKAFYPNAGTGTFIVGADI